MRRILIAEDNEEMRRLLARALRLDGHEIIAVRDGFELMHWIELMTRAPEANPMVDLIVTDLRMPMFSGLECMEQLRFAGDRTPVILITAFGDEFVHERAIASEDCVVLDKPLDLADLRRKVAEILA